MDESTKVVRKRRRTAADLSEAPPLKADASEKNRFISPEKEVALKELDRTVAELEALAPKRSPAQVQLADEMMKSQAEIDARTRANRAAAARFDFENANAAEEHPMREDLARIVEHTWVDGDADKIYEEIEASWELGEERTNAGALVKRLDEAHVRWRRAHRLLVTFRRERSAWERRNAPLFGAMWNSAERVLQKEKDAKERNKTITNEDVRAMCATVFGDQWAAQEEKREGMREAEKDLENMVEVARQAVSSIQSILAVRR